MRGQDSGEPFSKTATNATSAVASQSAVVGKTFFITDISGSSDKAASQIIVKDGTTVIWQDQIMQTAASTSWYAHQFSTPLRGTTGNLVSVTVDGTAVCFANIAGYAL